MSLNLRFSLLILGTAVLIFFGLAVAAYEFREEYQRYNWRDSLIPEIQSWTRSIVISSQPQEELRWIAQNRNVNVRVVMQDGSMYLIGAPMPSLHELHAHHPIRRRFTRNLPNNMRIYHYHDKYYLVHHTPAASVIYSIRSNFNPISFDEHIEFIARMFLLLLVAFVPILYITHRVLKPLKQVSTEMENFAQATKPVEKVRGKDEIKRVANSFAQMRQRVDDLLASKERLLRDVSHEIRSPLARIRLRLEFIADDQQREQLNHDITLIDNLASELLERAYLDSGASKKTFTQVDLGEILTEVVASFAEHADNIKLALPEQPVTIFGSTRLLTRCLSNLLQNSLKYSKLDKESILLKLSQTAEHAEIAISDHGEVIPATELDHLFEPFYRPDASRTSATGGTGLGLALVKSIVLAHGGEVHATSPATGGLSIKINLPLSSD